LIRPGLKAGRRVAARGLREECTAGSVTDGRRGRESGIQASAEIGFRMATDRNCRPPAEKAQRGLAAEGSRPNDDGGGKARHTDSAPTDSSTKGRATSIRRRRVPNPQACSRGSREPGAQATGARPRPEGIKKRDSNPDGRAILPEGLRERPTDKTE